MKQAKTLNERELKTVLATSATRRYAARDRAIVLTSFYAGLRAKEIAALTIGNVLGDDGSIRSECVLAAQQTKGRSARRIFFSSKLQRELGTYLKSLGNMERSRALFQTQKRTGFTANSMCHLFIDIYKSAGIDGASSHSGRRSLLTSLASKGVSVRVLQEVAGHKRAETGSKKEPFASLYADFGRLRNSSFAGWWLNRGRDLFAEPVAIPKVRAMEHMEVASHDMLEDFLHIEIPLKIRRKTILRQINKILDERHQGRELNLISQSKAKRRLYPKQRIRITTFKPIMDVWTARKESPDKSWWQIGSDLKLNRAYEASERDDEDMIKHKHRMMSLIVQRLHRKAKDLIKFAALGDFPRFR